MPNYDSTSRTPFAKGGKVGKKRQGYRAREDESISARRGKESTKKQSFKDRRDESYGKWGKRSNQKINKAIRRKGSKPGSLEYWQHSVQTPKRKGGRVNTSRENRLEELGRVDAEKSNKNRRAEKRRIVRELKK